MGILRQLDGAQAEVDLPAPGGEERHSSVEELYESGRGRNPAPPPIRRRTGLMQLPSIARKALNIAPPGVPRAALDNLVDLSGSDPFQHGDNPGVHALITPGAKTSADMSVPNGPRRANTFRLRPDPFSTALYVGVHPSPGS